MRSGSRGQLAVGAHERLGVCAEEVPVGIAAEDIEGGDSGRLVEVADADVEHAFERAGSGVVQAALERILQPLLGLGESVRRQVRGEQAEGVAHPPLVPKRRKFREQVDQGLLAESPHFGRELAWHFEAVAVAEEAEAGVAVAGPAAG